MKLAVSLLSLVIGSLTTQNADAGSASSLQIHIPKSLTRTGGYDHRDALFGTPEYDGSIQQKVYYTEDQLCKSDDSIVMGGYPQRKKKNTPWVAPYILLIDRGGCSFVQKVRNAQKVGAAAVIIADNTCLCSHGDACTPDDPTTKCEVGEPLMADDGSGSDITIPSFLMFKQDADLVKAELKQNHMVRLEMSWSKLNPQDGKVQYELWADPTETMSRTFLKDFQTAALKLGDHARFIPHMFIYDGLEMDCGENTTFAEDDEYCSDLCSVGGRYCANDPDGDIFEGNKGVDVVHESLRRECIWDIYGKANGIGQEWWDYVAYFNEKCLERPEYFKDKRCIEDAMHTANIDIAALSKCERESGDLFKNVPNQLFDTQLHDKERNGVVILPSIYINGKEVRGTLDFQTVFLAVCAGFTEDSEPAVCTACSHCIGYEMECVEHPKNKCPSSVGKNTVTTKTFLLWLTLTTFFILSIGMILYIRQQRQMKNQVRGLVSEYMPVGGFGAGNNGGNNIIATAAEDDFLDE